MADVTITNTAARLFIIPLGGGQVLRIAPLAKVTVKPQDVERVKAALTGPLRPHLERKHLIVEGVDASTATPTTAPPPPTAAPDPSAGPTPTLPFTPEPPTQPSTAIESSAPAIAPATDTTPLASSTPAESTATTTPTSSSKRSK